MGIYLGNMQCIHCETILTDTTTVACESCYLNGTEGETE
jgi:hypothetical protein